MSDKEWGTPVSKDKIIYRRNRLIEYQKTNQARYTPLYEIIDENILDINYMIYNIDKLQSNWNSLRECIIGVIEGAREELNTIIHTTNIDTKDGLEYVNQCSREFDVIRKNLEIVLDKMNELEGKDNN